ncbi:MAG TPA: MopE-related protein [Polyangia bacterium]|jgi:hypothetical protein
MSNYRLRALARLAAGVLVLAGGVQAQRAAAQTIVKPYFLVIVDVSGSMDGATTGSGNNSCGQARTKINDAKCVLSKLVNSYGDAVFGLARFKQTCSGTCTWGPSIDCTGCNNNGSGCPAAGATADRGEILVPIVEDNQARILKWVDFTCDTCTKDAVGHNPELKTGSWTPLAGSMRTARRYFQGADPDYGTSPITGDPYQSCRPYRVILLTDGQETCASDAQTYAAADELRATAFGGSTYDIRTYVIGFGVTAGDAQIEAIATHGGTDAPGANRGFYATDETSLAVAFSQIIADSIKVELCNGSDDNCNGEIDEGYNVGAVCTVGVGACQRSGHIVCDADHLGSHCDAVAGTGTTEVCNGIDDDCDGLTDEAPADCSGCVPQAEICDGHDNNCNGRIDEGVTRTCGIAVGECTKGTMSCVELSAPAASGTWTECTGQGPAPEQCDNKDNDCDGVTDGIVEPCPNPANPGIGACRLGTHLCTAGVWGTCVGEVLPTDEVCDGVDNDCDGETDEGNPGGGQTCMTACGEGVTACVNGQLVCQGGGTGQPEICNGLDDDCDGLTDEDLPSLGPCTDNGALCIPGTLECVGGSYQCVGGAPPEPERCDCLDNDCDGQTDEENGDPLCDAGATCLTGPYCQCALPCSEEEFPCPVGRVCATLDDGRRFCVTDACYGKVCPPTSEGGLTVCQDGACISVCETLSCSPPLVCRPTDGRCVEDNCLGFPERCQGTEMCVGGVCEANACAGVTCPDPETHCAGGVCVGSCAGVECPAGQACRHGVCSEDPCFGVSCPAGQACDFWTGTCAGDHCAGINCATGLVCDPATGDCRRDPCLGVACPGTQQCRQGDCYYPSELTDGGIVHNYITAAGGAGGCAAAGAAGGGGAGLLLLGLLVALRARRRS